MAHLFPFRGIVPAKDKIAGVVSRPFDKYTGKEVTAIVRENPDSFLHVIKPELVQGIRSNPEDPATLRKSREKFLDFIETGTLERADAPCFYIYRQQKPDFVYTGIIAVIHAGDYRNGTIRIHEQTLARREEKLKDYLKVVGINAEPVMFTYQHRNELDELVNRLSAQEPYADFSFDGKEHRFWVVNRTEDISTIQEQFSGLSHIYIADGHHRSASSVLLAEESENPAAQYFLGIFFPDHNLQLLEFNRLLKDTGGLGVQEILDTLSSRFSIRPVEAELYKPAAMHEISIYLSGKWYSLTWKNAGTGNASLEVLDADLLNRYILEPVFGIKDVRNDPRVDFMSGLYGPEALKKRVDEGLDAVAFGLYPVSFEQFFAFSDQGRIMPPKTTWFEPKLLNGLVVYDLEPSG